MSNYNKIILVISVVFCGVFTMSGAITLLSINNTIDNIAGLIIGISTGYYVSFSILKIINN